MPYTKPLGILVAGALLLSLGATPSSAVAAQSFAIRGQAEQVTMLPVLPGGVVTLEALDPASKQPLPVRWSVPAGTVSYQDRGAVWKAPTQTGLYRLEGKATVDGRAYRRVLSAFVTVPSEKAKNGVINGYRVGRYPALASRNARAAALLPQGFIKLDAESAQAPVGRSFKLGQFAVKDSPRDEKYMMLSPRLIEKLERIVDTLNDQGYSARSLRIMSGYRTPAYNSGIGNKTTLSRHTYGDAADVLADDWDRDGAITRKDAQILYRVADKLDRGTDLTGGLSLYQPNGSHGWFVHVDTRGKLARW